MLKLLAPRWAIQRHSLPIIPTISGRPFASHPNLPANFNVEDAALHGRTNPDGTPLKREPTAYELQLAADKERLKWRTPYGERPGEWYTKLKVFGTNKNEADEDMIAFMQQPIEFDLQARREKKERKRVADEKFMQQFVAERHRILGNDLAAAHFLVHRGASVK